MEMLSISKLADTIIGDETLGLRGISGGQKKRVNIGMELIASPSVLFLDEPTSGLDSSTSMEVCSLLQTIALTGVNVIVVLHQPRVEIFNNFDDLVLLAEGGRPVFIGDRAAAEPYFNTLGYRCPMRVNPADFLMDAIAGDVHPTEPRQVGLITLCFCISIT
jgi:ABC-type multidrug transport system ATPase subunit